MRLMFSSWSRRLFVRGGSLLRDTSGAVLMEYVLLGTVLLGSLVFVGNTLFDPAGAVNGDFGLFGNAFMDWYHRIVDTIALPVP
jgi:hypothetical protein